jgi:hypothetical protein
MGVFSIFLHSTFLNPTCPSLFDEPADNFEVESQLSIPQSLVRQITLPGPAAHGSDVHAEHIRDVLR